MTELNPERKQIGIRKFHFDKFDFQKPCTYTNYDNKLDIRRNGPNILLIGKCTRNTYLINDILYNHRDIHIGNVIVDSNHPTVHNYYEKILPKTCIHNDYDSTSVIDKTIIRQKVRNKSCYKELKNTGKLTKDPRTFLVFNDCIYDNKIWSSIEMANLFSNGIQLNIMSIFSATFPIHIPPNFRANLDYIFIHRLIKDDDKKRAHELYADFIPLKLFLSILEGCTQNYDCLVIDNSKQCANVLEHFFWYHVEIHNSDFKICHKQIWDQDHCANINDETLP